MAKRLTRSPCGTTPLRPPSGPDSPAPGRPSARPSANTSTRRSFPKRPTMTPHDDIPEDQDEEQIASLLSASLTDAAPVDPDFLARLRPQSTEAFTQSASADERNRPMRYPRGKWLAAAAASLVAAVGLYCWLVPGR